jgi:fluoroacetyl-CoA thioesterase
MTMVSKMPSDPGEPLKTTTSVVVAFKDTVAAIEPTMPPVAATPFLVTIAEIACYRLVQDQLEPGQITVGSRVVIDHLGPSKVGATLLVTATLLARDRKRFKFSVRIEDGERTIANVEHDRAAVSLQKIMSSLG